MNHRFRNVEGVNVLLHVALPEIFSLHAIDGDGCSVGYVQAVVMSKRAIVDVDLNETMGFDVKFSLWSERIKLLASSNVESVSLEVCHISQKMVTLNDDER